MTRKVGANSMCRFGTTAVKITVFLRSLPAMYSSK